MKESNAKGVRSIVVFVPTIIVIGILYIIILISTVFIDNYTTKMYDETYSANECIDEITKLQSASSLMSETVTIFAYNPLVGPPTGKFVNPALGAFKEELYDDEKSIDYVIEKLDDFNIKDEDLEKILICADDAREMRKVESRVLTLLYSIESIKAADKTNVIKDSIDKLPSYTLGSEDSNELTYTDEEKQAKALEILLTKPFTDNKSDLSTKIREVQKSISNQNEKKQDDLIFRVKMLRGVLWGSILLIVLANIMFFFVILKRLVLPINRFSRQIKNDEELDPKNCLYEPRLLAREYNILFNKRKEFEHELRMVAEIDSLTGLPNRYCYNEFLKNASLDKNSICVFLFDINNLKYVNDNFGHAKGDELIKNASYCIIDCFQDDTKKNCYRIGGDEFVAIVDNIKEDKILDLVNKFRELQKKYDVSIAMGYVYSNDLKTIGYEKLIMKADNNMYIDKEQMKNNN